MPLEATPARELAATMLQARYRGHAVRSEQQEAARLQWLHYHVQPEVGEWEQAVELAVSEEELEMIRRKQRESNGEEERRIKWLSHYTAANEFDRAAELAVTPVEAATVLRARAVHATSLPGRLCSCVCNSSAGVEARRAEQFVGSIRRYEYAVARALARTDDERQDVADSESRTQCLSHFVAAGEFDKARELCILGAEVSRVNEAEARRANGK